MAKRSTKSKVADKTSAVHLASGKVREIWQYGDSLVLVATDRLSAYDVVFGEEIPDRGRVLTLMSQFWMSKLANVVPNHLIEVIADKAAADRLPSALGAPDYLVGRTTVCRKAQMLPIECIVRGYLYGSAWKEYQSKRKVSGVPFPDNMQLAEKLPSPIFTPSTKATEGHDVNIDMDAAYGLVGRERAEEVAGISIDLYEQASSFALERGVIIADTKFEFGLIDGKIVLCDEVFTPDSSRFWYTKDWQPGIDPPSLDKQFVRNYLDETDWDKTPPAPHLPPDVVEATRDRYIEAYEVLTGSVFSDGGH